MAVWNEDAHPRASAGTATGGQFSAGGSAPAPTTTVSTHPGSKSTKVHLVHGHKVKAPHQGGGGGRGAKGGKGNTRVRTLQTALNRLGATDGKGAKLAVDGKFGPLTTQAVKKVQAALGLPVDGRVSPKLLRRLSKLKTLPVRAKASVTAAELLFGPSAVWESWDPMKHPRGHGGKFSSVTHALGHARHRGEVEHEIFRGPGGGAVKALRGQREVAELKVTAAHKMEMEDRVDQRLRFGEQTHGHWFMIKGSRYWVKEDNKPGWHNGFYYWPGRPFPVTPPREDWETRHSYNGFPSTATTPGTPLSHLVPDDVRRAASMSPEDRAGKRMVGPGADRTAKSERFQVRKARAGLGGHSEDHTPSKRFRSRPARPRKQKLGENA